MQILQQAISLAELKELAQNTFGDMIKAVADVKRGQFDSLINIRSWQGNPSRVLKALEAGKESRAMSAFARFQELIDLTIRYGRLGQSTSARSAMWEELCRFRELYCAAFEKRNLPELAAANRYLDQFASIR